MIADGNQDDVGNGKLVRRAVRPNTALVQAVLDHLAGAGVDWAPRFLGVDRGQEVLGWVPGVTKDDWRSNPRRLDALAHIVRDFHDRTANLTDAAECIVHDDLQPRNIVIGSDSLTIIDWEQLRLGRRVEDVSQLCWSFASPTTDDQPEDVGRRWQRVLDAYGLDDRSDVVAVAITKIERCIDDIIGEAQRGSDRHQLLQERGDHHDLQEMLDWLVDHREQLVEAIT